MNGNADEVRNAIKAFWKADRDMVAFELDEGDGEETFLGEGSTY